MEPQLNGSPYATGPLSGLSVYTVDVLWPNGRQSQQLLSCCCFILTLLRFNVVFCDVAYMRSLNDWFTAK